MGHECPLMLWKIQVQIPSPRGYVPLRKGSTWDFGFMEYLPSWTYHSAQGSSHWGMGCSNTISHIYLFIETAMSISSRKDSRKQLPWALLSRTWSSGVLPQHIHHNRHLAKPLSWEIWTRGSDQPLIWEETKSLHLANCRNKSLSSLLENCE